MNVSQDLDFHLESHRVWLVTSQNKINCVEVDRTGLTQRDTFGCLRDADVADDSLLPPAASTVVTDTWFSNSVFVLSQI